MILSRSVLRFYESVWFSMPNIFGKPFFPRFWLAELFWCVGRAFGHDFEILNSVDGIFRYAEIP